jgi:hypothetical protein
MKAAPHTAFVGGAARRVSALLLGASSHAQKPPTNKAEGAAKKEEAGAMHDRQTKGGAKRVKRSNASWLLTFSASLY